MSEPTRNLKNKTNLSGFENPTPMSHEEALDLNAVELYVLKELPPEEELRFEEHYFACRECARAVAVVQTLASAAPPLAQPWWRRLAFPVLIPATAALLAIAAFQTFHSIPYLEAQLAALSAPQANTAITAHPVQLGAEGGEPIKTPSVTIELNLPVGAASAFYRVEILGEGKIPVSQVIPAPEGSRLSLHVMSLTLGHGSFNVLVYGLAMPDSKDGPQIGQYQFKIQ
jgi:hypothetical protein